MMMMTQMRRRILEARCNVQNMSSMDAKMTYIRAWQRLADSGTAYFIVTFKGSKKKVHYFYTQCTVLLYDYYDSTSAVVGVGHYILPMLLTSFFSAYTNLRGRYSLGRSTPNFCHMFDGD